MPKRDRKEYMREYRRRIKAAATPKPPDPVTNADPIGALQTWSRENLVVPPGHPLAGEPMELPDFAADFLREGWQAHESALTCARKNAKSAIARSWAWAFLSDPCAFLASVWLSPVCQKRRPRSCGNKSKALAWRPAWPNCGTGDLPILGKSNP